MWKLYKITVFVIKADKQAKENYLEDSKSKTRMDASAAPKKLKVMRAVPIYTYVTSRTSFTLHHLNAIVPLIFFTHTPTPLLLTFTLKKLPHPIYTITFANLHNNTLLLHTEPRFYLFITAIPTDDNAAAESG